MTWTAHHPKASLASLGLVVERALLVDDRWLGAFLKVEVLDGQLSRSEGGHAPTLQRSVHAREQEGFGDEDDLKAEPEPSEHAHGLFGWQQEDGDDVSEEAPGQNNHGTCDWLVEEEGKEHGRKESPARRREPRYFCPRKAPVQVRVFADLLVGAGLDRVA